MMKRARVLEQLVVRPGTSAGLAGRDPSWAAGPDYGELSNKAKAKALLAREVEELSQAQELLWANHTRALLVILQAMDGAGKDSAIKHVLSGVNPQGVQVVSFKQPSAEELDHDFLWRISKAAPERGRIGIFNRSHYEEVVAVRVHPEWLEKQRVPAGTRGPQLWGRTVRGHQRLRAPPRPERHDAREVLPPRVEGGAEEALSRAAR
jgi:polyphosphate kinase 2 (PPK2 family)